MSAAFTWTLCTVGPVWTHLYLLLGSLWYWTNSNVSWVRSRVFLMSREFLCWLVLLAPTDGVGCFFIIKPTTCTNFTNLFWHETLHVSGSSSVHHQEFIHCSLSNGICHIDSFRAGSGWNSVPSRSCSKTAYKLLWHTIAECTVNKLLMMDRRTVRNM